MGRRLVRDRALEMWVVPGAEHQVRPVRDRDEHLALLRAKVIEEATEVAFAEDTAELVKELADLLEVMQALAHLAQGVSWSDVTRSLHYKAETSGGFTVGTVWDTGR